MKPNNYMPSQEEDQRPMLPSAGNTHVPKPIRSQKAIVHSTEAGRYVDRRVIAHKYYNCFNFSLLRRHNNGMKGSIGITSPNPREGKTLVACNLAVSLSLGCGQKTVLVDLNVQQPRIHDIFGTSTHPGLLDALDNGSVHVSPTSIDGLSVLAAGDARGARLGLGDLVAFQQVLWSLEEEFQFVIVDMPSVTSRGFPLSVASLLNGVLLVIDTMKTKRRDVDRVFRQLSEDQILGLVFNRFNEDSL